MERILLTGANGLMGQKFLHLVAREPSLEVMATSRKPLPGSTDLAPERFALLDIRDGEAFAALLDQFVPTVVLNTAAMTQVDDCEKDQALCHGINARAPATLAKLCADRGIRLVHISTDFVFSGQEGPLDETAQPDPVNYYGRCKLEGEQAVLRYPEHAVLRTVLVYGLAPYMSRSNLVLWVRESLSEGKPVRVVTDQWRTPTLAEDLAEAALLAIKHRAKGIYHISGEEMMTPYEMALATAATFGLDASLIGKADAGTFRQVAQRPPKTGFLIGKAKRDLGFAPKTFAEGLAMVKEQWEKMAGQ